jgi:hypothetical protein
MKLFALLLFTVTLSFATAPAAPAQNVGGSQQVAAQAGCMNQWMFNGVWRMRVTSVAFHPTTAPPGINGWDVTMQWGNGTSQAGLSPVNTMKQPLVLQLANGDTLTTTDSTTGTLNEQQLDYHTFPQSGQFTYTQSFFATQTLDPSNKPAKLLVTFDVPKYRQTYGSNGKLFRQKTRGYNYRIDLTCSK